ncbi:Rrf2 family transcriptional regulator [Polaribacter cellanae]|uniref:Rrf2 family transcriptional regulator n=1 Tax=Polaribacter cellanae TaxID=2818493 RepID=A0A975H7P6_9FLAO|nr:Rrf2 family transcriptional regulator [Polaribacter cellanae]
MYLTNKASVSNKIGSKEVAKKLNIPAPFLAKVIQELTKKGIVSSVKESNGEFYLSEINEKNTMYNIIEMYR